MPKPQPCRIGGVDYPSQAAAARALGLSHAAIWKALEEGREDELPGKQGRPGTPTRANGKRHASRKAAAAALGISPHALGMRLLRMRRSA